MERCLVLEDDDLQAWRITAKIMKKQLWTADEGWPSTMATDQTATNSSYYKMLHRPSNVDRFFELAARLLGFEKLRYAQIAMTKRGIYKCALYRPTHNFWRGFRFNSIIDEERLLTHNTVLNGN
jgi:hypothetical protein